MSRGLFLVHVLNKGADLLRNKNAKTVDEAIDKAFSIKKKQYLVQNEQEKMRINYKEKLNKKDIKYLRYELNRHLKWIKEDELNKKRGMFE